MTPDLRPHPALRIGIAQPLMQWSGDRNAESIVRLLERAAGEDARICVFPELSIPGFHRGIRELAKPELLAGWLQSVQAACARHGIGAVLRAPTFPTLLFWPGLMGPEEGLEHLEPPRHVQQAQAMARRLQAYIVQANWPNSLNYPEKSSTTGGSVVVSPGGSIELVLPAAASGIGIFNLGESAFAWLAQ